MLLIYTHHPTNRVKYTFSLVFKSVLGIDYEITSDAETFKRFEGAKLSYGETPVENEIFIRSSTFLFKTGIEKPPIAISDKIEKKILFILSDSSLVFDPFAASFFLASRFEEYLPFSPDRYGRFPAAQSLAVKNDFLRLPLINIWAQEIRKMISSRYSLFSFPEKKYSYIPTVDIDNAYAFYGKGIARTIGGYARALLRSDSDDFSKRQKVLSGKETDPFDTYDFQRKLHKKYNLDPVYFFLLGDWAPNDKNLSHTNPRMKSLIKNISGVAETGIHPSFSSNQNPEKIKTEKERLEKIKKTAVTKSRQHFLKLKFPVTYRNLLAAGITDDYSMGFADEPGFRAGICTPYKFYDLKKEEETGLTIHPFSVMDATLNIYMKLSPEQALEKVKKLVKEVKNVNGEFITIWHNESLSDWRDWKGWKNVYEEVIKAAV